MAIPAYLWLKDDGGADIKGSVDVQDREGSIEVTGFSHNLSLPTDGLVPPLTGDDPDDQLWLRTGIDYAKRAGF